MASSRVSRLHTFGKPVVVTTKFGLFFDIFFRRTKSREVNQPTQGPNSLQLQLVLPFYGRCSLWFSFQLFSGARFPCFFGGCPTKNGPSPKKGSLFFPGSLNNWVPLKWSSRNKNTSPAKGQLPRLRILCPAPSRAKAALGGAESHRRR